MVTPGARREAVAHARAHHGLSQLEACAVVGVSHRVVRYQSTRPDDAALRQAVAGVGGRAGSPSTDRTHSKPGGNTLTDIADQHAPRHALP